MNKEETERRHAKFLGNMWTLNLNNKEIALIYGVHVRSVERWFSGSRRVSMSILNFTDACVIVHNKYPKVWSTLIDHFFKEGKCD